MALALIGALVGGGLFAYFSDTETSTGNTFTAGTIEILLTGDIGVPVHGTMIDFKPCETGYLNFTVENIGENDVDVWKHIAIQDDPATPEVVEGDPLGLAAQTWFDLSIDGIPVIYDGEILLSNVVCKWIYLGTIATGETIIVKQSFHIDADTGNDYQGAQITFDEEYTGQQVTNPSLPGTELTGYGR